MSTHGFLSIAHNTDLLFNIRVLSVSLNSICFSVQFSSVAWSCPTFCNPHWTAARQTSLSIPRVYPNSWPLGRWSAVVPFSSCLQSFPTSGSFQMSQLSKNWSFSFTISPSDEHPERISFRMDWLDFLETQGTLKSFLQHHSSKASILLRSAFFIVHLYILYTEEKHSWV